MLEKYASRKSGVLLNINESQSIIQIIIQAYTPFPRTYFFQTLVTEVKHEIRHRKHKVKEPGFYNCDQDPTGI